MPQPPGVSPRRVNAAAPSRSRYSATLTGGPLMLPESRRIAALRLQSPTLAEWRQAIGPDNLLQKNSPATAVRLAGLIRDRLDTLPRVAWEIVANGSQEAATQTLLVAALFHSALLADFMHDVLLAHHRRFDNTLSRRAWEPFLADCAARDTGVDVWTAATRAKLWQVIVRILVEARYLDAPRTLRLRTPGVHPDLARLLKSLGENKMIDLLELQPLHACP